MTALRVIGLISGTSVDAVDVAVADLRLDGDLVELTPLGHAEVGYPERVRADLLAALPPGTCTAETLCRLDTEVGKAFADAAATALAEIADGRADLVSSLGQTIYHWVTDGVCHGTLQLGQPAWIAERTGLPVVADLRARDVAAGGHGAPLVALFDRLLLADAAETTAPGPVAALNIGGIANITVVGPAGHTAETAAFDTGPGNALLDVAAGMVAGKAFDADGALAASGRVHQGLLDALLADPYYARKPPKSTGKEHFHAAHLRTALDQIGGPVDGVDLLATLVELTAVTIADACRAHGVGHVVASGGGVRNPTLMAALARHLAPATLTTSDRLGVPSEAKEAYLAALLGFLTWCGVPGNCPSATGARGSRLLGSITPGGAAAYPPPPIPSAPGHEVTRMRVLGRRQPASPTHSSQPVGGSHART